MIQDNYPIRGRLRLVDKLYILAVQHGFYFSNWIENLESPACNGLKQELGARSRVFASEANGRPLGFTKTRDAADFTGDRIFFRPGSLDGAEPAHP
jgi:hypothetical protein